MVQRPDFLHGRLHHTALIGAFAVLGYSTPANAQEAVPTQVAQPAVEEAITPPSPRPTATMARTFAAGGLLAEYNSNENYGAFLARLGTLRAYETFSRSTGIVDGFSASVESLALPLKATVPFSPGSKRSYLRAGIAGTWTYARRGNLTEPDSRSASGQVALVLRPEDNLVLGIGLVASETAIDLRHNGGRTNSAAMGLQADAMLRISDHWGLVAKTTLERGENRISIPLGRIGRTISYAQDFDRIYAEASIIANFPGSQSPLVPDGLIVRPILTVLYQATGLNAALDNRGVAHPGYTEQFGIARFALRVEKDESRPWHFVPYASVGLERDFVNTVSSVSRDPASLYLKVGVGTNVGGIGRLDLFHTRRESLGGTYHAGQTTLFLSLLF